MAFETEYSEQSNGGSEIWQGKLKNEEVPSGKDQSLNSSY